MSRTRHSDQQFALDLDTETQGPTGSVPAIDTRQLFTCADTMDELLDHWQQRDWLRPLDVGFARLIRTLSEEQGESSSPLVVLLAALVSHQVGRGHVCVDLTNLLQDADATLALPPDDAKPVGTDEEAATGATPAPGNVLARISLNDCLEALAGSSAVSEGSLTTPLVLNDTRLYLRRLWHYERQIADGIRARLALTSPLADPSSEMAATLAEALETLFGRHPGVDYQKLACALAARNRFAVITGGPGTGKTTTVVNLLAALQSVASQSAQRDGRKYRIRLAAPTGKAAARLNESIGGATNRLPLDRLPGQVSLDDIPTRVTTLHRLLGSRPDTRRFRHNRDNPLLVDILVIDEASMVDVDLMASVFEALPASAQLILLGDKDQLASVDAGAVLGELCQRATAAHYTPDTAGWLNAVIGATLPDALLDSEGQRLDQAVAMLRTSYRFGEGSGIGKLAEAVNTNALDAPMLAACRNGSFDDVIWLNGDTPTPATDETLARIADHAISGSPVAFRNGGEGRQVNAQPLPPPVGYGHYLSLLNTHALTEESGREAWDELARQTLKAFSDFQVLCALRKGPWGVDGINNLVARQLLAHKLIPKAEGWYPGRPVLVTGNDYNLGLMNGDIGITLSVPWDRDDNGQPKHTLRVAFPAADGSDDIRWISPSRLQQLETVYAMTVHKSQGSEFNHTCLVLPDRISPVMTRELIYTGITRARNWFSLITGDAGVFQDSAKQQVVRASGLARGLIGR
ncbi:exodeoxyribonuclease V subunit alpha [Marinobacter sp. F4206]|uniref:exodeoxyribonuclease V subunit alpha n=1 Tax=Marinobacter sp. F4206 TaxID=2861777 RepID=UPI001C5EA92A|nr:exodeoxyribonuclease V subunit alpha [Marinobacter sp. F4206]MBW4935044.1 exodeoxyribonuclease V subunit alpha [Marinobacter sp. F4206]